MNAARRYDVLQAELAQDDRRARPARERWPNVSNYGATCAWWCETCVKTGPQVARATAEDRDAIEADFARHCASDGHLNKLKTVEALDVLRQNGLL